MNELATYLENIHEAQLSGKMRVTYAGTEHSGELTFEQGFLVSGWYAHFKNHDALLVMLDWGEYRLEWFSEENDSKTTCFLQIPPILKFFQELKGQGSEDGGVLMQVEKFISSRLNERESPVFDEGFVQQGMMLETHFESEIPIRHLLQNGVWTLGSSQSKCDFRFKLPTVSGVHCQIKYQGGDEFLVVDLGSRYGTFVNGFLVDQEVVYPGDEITLGEIPFLVTRCMSFQAVPTHPQPESRMEKPISATETTGAIPVKKAKRIHWQEFASDKKK